MKALSGGFELWLWDCEAMYLVRSWVLIFAFSPLLVANFILLFVFYPRNLMHH